METESSIQHLQMPSPIPILSQINPVHAPVTRFEEPFEHYASIYG